MTSTRRSGPPLAVPSAFALLALAAPAAADPSRYPRAVIARPLTFPSGLLAVGADAGGNHDLSAMTGAPIVGYGITDALEVQVPYAFATHDFHARGTVAVDAGYAIVRGALSGKLEMIARVRGGYDTLALAAMPVLAGIHVQYNLAPWLALISGAPGNQQLSIARSRIELALPIGLGLQAIETLYVQLDARVVAGGGVPLCLTLVWNALPALDVQGAVTSDVDGPLDALTFLIGARFYAGELR